MVESKMRILPKLNFAMKASELLSLTKSVLESGVRELDRIGAVSQGNCTFRNVILPLAQLEASMGTRLGAASFLQYVSSEESIRKASVEATKLIDKYEIDKSTREDLFRVTRCVADNAQEMSSLDGESRRLVDKMMIAFRRNGLFLDTETRSLLKAKRTRLAELSVDYSNNMNEDRTELLLTAEELEGCPPDFLEGRETRRQDDGTVKYVLTMKYPDVFGVLKYAKSESVRRRMDAAFNDKCRQANAPILEEAVRLRYECARLLGYKNHAELQLVESLAKTSSDVLNFEEDLRRKLVPLAKKELGQMRDLKAKETGDDSAIIYSYDYHYYARQILERDYAIDNEQLKQYYSLEMVMGEMLHIYEQVLGLHFTPLDEQGSPKSNANGGASGTQTSTIIWHPDVSLYEVTNASDGSLVGHIYLDLFPREGKYTHAACFPLQPGCTLEGGHRQYPVAAMVCNFTKPTPSKPSLLTHEEVVTLFHELGHAMHEMCAVTHYSRFHGTNVERDFVEAPSQMLENWCWDEAMLGRLARHYQRPEETLPKDIIKQLVRAKQFNAGLLNLRQIFFGLFDMTIHTIERENVKEALGGQTIDQLYEHLRAQVTLIPQQADISPASSFGHMMGGYDAGYYGYLWSQVFSADMFYSRFRKEGLLSEMTGEDYRRKILGPGGSRPGMDSVVDFLGRKPNNEAFLKSLGLEVPAEEERRQEL